MRNMYQGYTATLLCRSRHVNKFLVYKKKKGQRERDKNNQVFSKAFHPQVVLKDYRWQDQSILNLLKNK